MTTHPNFKVGMTVRFTYRKSGQKVGAIGKIRYKKKRGKPDYLVAEIVCFDELMGIYIIPIRHLRKDIVSKKKVLKAKAVAMLRFARDAIQSSNNLRKENAKRGAKEKGLDKCKKGDTILVNYKDVPVPREETFMKLSPSGQVGIYCIGYNKGIHYIHERHVARVKVEKPKDEIYDQLGSQIKRATDDFRMKVVGNASFNRNAPNTPYSSKWDGQLFYSDGTGDLVDQVVAWMKRTKEDRAKDIQRRIESK